MGSPKIQLALLFFIWVSLECSSYSLPSEYFVVGQDQLDQFPSAERVAELFKRWKEKHGKAYNHAEEAERRFENFKRNLKYVLEKNNANARSSNSHRVGLNKFADLRNEEFREVYLSNVKKPINRRNFDDLRRIMQGRIQSCEAPSALDWRKRGVVTGVKDQGDCGKFCFNILF